MTDRKGPAVNGFRRVGMSAILNVLKPLDATSCATTDRKRRMIANVCRMIGDELGAASPRSGKRDRGGALVAATPANGHEVHGTGPGTSAHGPNGAESQLLLRSDVSTDGPLSPRLQQTLQSLLAGDSEKQVARKLGLSPHTVHVYVKKLYRRYGVSSRAELLAKWVAR